MVQRNHDQIAIALLDPDSLWRDKEYPDTRTVFYRQSRKGLITKVVVQNINPRALSNPVVTGYPITATEANRLSRLEQLVWQRENSGR